MAIGFYTKVCFTVLVLALWPASCAWAKTLSAEAAAAGKSAEADTTAEAAAKAEAAKAEAAKAEAEPAAKACATATTGDDIRTAVKSSPLNSVPVYVDWGSWGGP